MEGQQGGHAHAEAVARDAYGKLVAFLAAQTGDIAAAEDALSEAFVAALRHWGAGIPDNPEGWLVSIARRRLIDQARKAKVRAAHMAEVLAEEALDQTDLSPCPDRRLELMFACAHPAIDAMIHTPLILQTVVGVAVEDIARAMLLKPATLAQRLVRAKAKIRTAGVPFRIPEEGDRALRFPAILDALYVVYGTGWEDVADGADCHHGHATEGIWLARITADLAPDEPEALGLLSLMLHAEARRAARFDAAGHYLPVDQQDAAQWDLEMITEAEAVLKKAFAAGRIGRFQLEAAIQSALAQRAWGGAVDWEAIARFSDRLVTLTRSPTAIVNHAAALVALCEYELARQALQVAAADPRMACYQPYWATRFHVLHALGDSEGSQLAASHAIALCRNEAVRRWLAGKVDVKDAPERKSRDGVPA